MNPSLEQQLQRLQRLQESLARAQRIAHLGSWEHDLATGQLEWSAETYRIFGLEPASCQATYAAFIAAVHPEDRPLMATAHEQAIRGEMPLEVEHRIVRPSGEIRWVREIGELECDPAGQPLFLTGVIQDITAQRQAEHSAAATEARLQQQAESLPHMVWTARPDGSVDYANHHLFDYTGISREADPATRWQDFLHPDDLPRCMEAWSAALRTGARFDIEYRLLRHADRSYRWFCVQAAPIRNAGGEVILWYGTAIDIDETKHLQAEASRLAQRLTTTLESITDAFYTLDRNWCFTYLNSEAERLLKRDRNSLLGRCVWQEFPETVGAEIERQYRLAVEQPCTVDFQTHYPPLDAWFEIRAYPSEEGLAVYFRDITERLKLEQQFFRAQRMESIGTLAGGIAHDLNNLLAPIVMGVDLLRQITNNPRAVSIIDNISRSARRGTDLVKQVLSFARGVEGARVPLQIGPLLREVEAIILNTFPKNIQLDRTLPRDLWSVVGDPTQLNQVLLNLCVNARDAMPDGGRLTLTVSNAEIDQQVAVMDRNLVAGRYLVIEVADEGCGMPKEVMDRVFEPFFTTKEIGKGTGLGLSTVIGIVRSHGGFINVYSEPGRGSVFKVYLPAMVDSEPAPLTAAEAKPTLPRGNGELILVVDDEVSILTIAKQTLEAFGYRVLTAEDGAQAIARFAEHRTSIDLVLTDMMMPVMDGPALIVALHRINPRQRIIAASGLNANGNVAKASRAGVHHFLPKPYSASAMLNLIREVLESPPPDPQR